MKKEKKLYSVSLEYEMAVIAEDESDAIYIARRNVGDDETSMETATLITERRHIPYGYENSYPYGDFDTEDFDGTLSEIFDRIEERKAEEDRKKRIFEEMDKKQLKFDFYQP